MRTRIVKWVIRACVVAAAAGAAVLLFFSFGDFRRWLLIGATALVVPVVVFLVVSAIRVGRWSMGPLALLATAGVIVVAAGSVGSYRAFIWTTCAERVGPESNLRGCNLSGRELQQSDLAKADLSKATLLDTTLSDSDMSGSKLNGATLESASLSGANLDHADLSGATLTSADLSGATLRNITASRADFSYANLADANLSAADLSGASLAGADLQHSDLSGVDLGSATAASANFSSANLSAADLTGADLSGANLTDADLEKAIGASVNFSSAALSGADLTDADLTGADLSGATVSKTNFTGAILSDVKLDGAKLLGAVGLTDATLSSALNVSRLDLAAELSKKHLFLDSEAAITATVGAACRGRAIPDAGTSRSKGTFVVVLRSNGRSRVSGLAVGPEPTAIRYVELVVCLGPETQNTIESCPYVIQGGSERAYMRRYDTQQVIRLVNAHTGQEVAEQTLESHRPDSCPFTTPFYPVNGQLTPIGTTLETNDVRWGISSMIVAHPVR